MEELEQLCKDEGLSFLIDYNNHKRFGLSVRKYAEQFWADSFKDEEGQRWIEAMERRNTIVGISIYDSQFKQSFTNYDCDFCSCVKETIRAIQEGIHKASYVGPEFVYTPPPLN